MKKLTDMYFFYTYKKTDPFSNNTYFTHKLGTLFLDDLIIRPSITKHTTNYKKCGDVVCGGLF